MNQTAHLHLVAKLRMCEIIFLSLSYAKLRQLGQYSDRLRDERAGLNSRHGNKMMMMMIAAATLLNDFFNCMRYTKQQMIYSFDTINEIS